MGFSAKATDLEEIALWRDMYRLEMACAVQDWGSADTAFRDLEER
jgi:hypothetical protein